MEDHLRGRDWMVESSRSLADIALYAYTHVADEGGFDLDRYPEIKSWIDRVESHNMHICMADMPA